MAKKNKDVGGSKIGSLFMFGTNKKTGNKEVITKPGKYLKPGDIENYGDFLKVMKKSGFKIGKDGKLKNPDASGAKFLAPFARLFAQMPGVRPSDLPNAPKGTFGPPYGPGGGARGGGTTPSTPQSSPASTYTPPLSAGTLAVARLIGKRRGM